MDTRLKAFRKNEGLTQEEMAEILSENGYECKQQSYSRVENQSRTPPYRMLLAFKRAFPFDSIDEIFFDGDDSKLEGSYNSLKDFREKNNLTQKDVINLLKETGYEIKQPCYIAYEKNKANIPNKFMKAFKQAFPSASLDEIFIKPYL